MTYATLTQVTTQESAFPSEPYQPVGTDEAEYIKWQQLMGNTEEHYDPQSDLEELGIR